MSDVRFTPEKRTSLSAHIERRRCQYFGICDSRNSKAAGQVSNQRLCLRPPHAPSSPSTLGCRTAMGGKSRAARPCKTTVRVTAFLCARCALWATFARITAQAETPGANNFPAFPLGTKECPQ